MGIFVPKTCIIKFYVIDVVDGKNTTHKTTHNITVMLTVIIIL